MAAPPDWTGMELDQLRTLAGAVPNREIAQRLGRTRNAVALKIGKLGLSSLRSRWQCPWSDTETAALRDCLGLKQSAWMAARATGHSLSAVYKKAYALGMTFNGAPLWTLQEETLLRELAITMNARQIATRMARTARGVEWKASQMGVSLSGGKKTRRSWTQEQDEILRNEAASGKGARHIGQLCGKSHTGVYNRAKRLGVVVQSGHWWTELEKGFLRLNAHLLTARELERALGRDHKSIRAQAKSMGLEIRRRFDGESAARRRDAQKINPLRQARKRACLSPKLDRMRPEKTARPVAQPKVAKVGEIASKRSKRAPVAYAPLLVWCETCRSPVVNTASGMAGHRERVGCNKIATSLGGGRG